MCCIIDIIPYVALPTIPAGISENCRDFLLKTLAFDYNERPSAKELLEHPYIKGNPHCKYVKTQIFVDVSYVKAQTFTDSHSHSESKVFTSRDLRSEHSQANFESQLPQRPERRKTFVINVTPKQDDQEQSLPRTQTLDPKGFKGTISLDVRRSADVNLDPQEKVDNAEDNSLRFSHNGLKQSRNIERDRYNTSPHMFGVESSEFEVSQLKNPSKSLVEEEQKQDIGQQKRMAELRKWEEEMRKELDNVTSQSSMSSLKSVVQQSDLTYRAEVVNT